LGLKTKLKYAYGQFSPAALVSKRHVMLFLNQISYNYETNCILKRKKKGEYIPFLKYSVPIFVE